MTDASSVSLPQAPPVIMKASLAAVGEFWHTVLRVTWLAIGLGLALEILLLMLAPYTVTAGETPKPFIADLTQKISWWKAAK